MQHDETALHETDWDFVGLLVRCFFLYSRAALAASTNGCDNLSCVSAEHATNALAPMPFLSITASTSDTTLLFCFVSNKSDFVPTSTMGTPGHFGQPRGYEVLKRGARNQRKHEQNAVATRVRQWTKAVQFGLPSSVKQVERNNLVTERNGARVVVENGLCIILWECIGCV